MPKEVMDYSNVIFYKIKCLDTTIHDFYIGHTTDFISRKYQHKANCNTNKSRNCNAKLYKFIRDNGGWDNWIMTSIETKSCKDSHDALNIEKCFINELGATLNTYAPILTDEERMIITKTNNRIHYLNNKEERIDAQRQYYDTNREYCKIRQREYYAINKEAIQSKSKNTFYDCECGVRVAASIKAQHFKTSKHIAWVKDSRVYEDKFICECGGMCSKYQKVRHFTTKRHQRWIEVNEISTTASTIED